jgi:hypothetical protein
MGTPANPPGMPPFALPLVCAAPSVFLKPFLTAVGHPVTFFIYPLTALGKDFPASLGVRRMG